MQPRGRSWRTHFYHMRTKEGIPPDLDWEAHHLETEQSVFWRKGNVIKCGRTKTWKKLVVSTVNS